MEVWAAGADSGAWKQHLSVINKISLFLAGTCYQLLLMFQNGFVDMWPE
jgi:hypothetical protein